MKITKRQLKQIIRENTSFSPMKSRANPMVQRAVENSRQQERLRENQAFRHPKTGENMLLMINDLVNHLLDQGFDTLELANELRGLADDVEDSQPFESRRDGDFLSSASNFEGEI